MSKADIARYCDPVLYPADLAEEEAIVRAQERLEKRRQLTQSDLDQLAAKSPPPSDWTYE